MKTLLQEIEQEERLSRFLVQPGLNILGGRPSSGKTELALRTAAPMPLHYRTLYCAYEHSTKGILERAEHKCRTLPNRMIVLDEPTLLAEHILDEFFQNRSIGLVVVDYLGLVKEEIYDFLQFLLHGTQGTVPIIILSQLTKEAEVSTPSLEHIPDAQKVLSLASRVFLLGQKPSAFEKSQGIWLPAAI